MIFFYFAIAIVVCTLFFLVFKKKKDRNQLLGIFRHFNQEKNLNIILDWIGKSPDSSKLAAVLEYLKDTEQEKLAIELLDQIHLDAVSDRHVLIFAAQAYLEEEKKRALELANRLFERDPSDDSILELYIDAHLTLGDFKRAKDVLVPRLQKKYKGTMFTRHYARVLAREGELDRAIEIMEQVSKRDFVLFQNTFAMPQKGLIRKQFETSQALLEYFREQQNDAANSN